MNNYLYIFLHIPKTGGSTFRKHIEKNIPENQRWSIDFAHLRMGIKKISNKMLFDEIEKEMEYFTRARKDSIRVIYGQMVPYGIHKYFNKIPRYIVTFRDPEKRLMSLYNFFMTRYRRESAKGVTNDAYKYQLFVSNKLPNFGKWIQSKYGKSGMAIETTLQHLKNLGYLKSVYDRSEYKKALDKFYYICITKHLNEDFNYLYWEMGFKKFFVNQNVSTRFVESFDKHREAGPFLKRNMVFYKMAVDKRDKIVNKIHASRQAKKMGMIKIILLPMTQVVFDLQGLAVETSAYLRRKCPIYGKLYDFIRGYKTNR